MVRRKLGHIVPVRPPETPIYDALVREVGDPLK